MLVKRALDINSSSVFLLSHPSLLLSPTPYFFLLHKLSINPPLCGGTGFWRCSRGGGNFIGPEPNNLINIAPLAPFSLFLSLSLSSLCL